MKKTIVSFVSVLTGIVVGASVVKKATDKSLGQTKNLSDKHLALFLMMNQWVKVKQAGKNLESYFIANDYKRIAIYGMSYAGETLLDELRGSEVKVAYGIDKNADSIYTDIDIVSIEDALEKVDVIVVTAISFFDEIEEKLSTKVECPIVSLEDILYEM